MIGDASKTVVTEWYGDRRLRRFWALGLVAVGLHTVLDPVTTYVAVTVFEAGTEANPWLAGYLAQGAWAFAAIHLPVYLITFGVLGGFTWLYQQASAAEAAQLYRLSLVAWSGIILWGLLVVANNLLVVVGYG